MADEEPLYVRPPKQISDMSDDELASWTRGVADGLAATSPSQPQPTRRRGVSKVTASFALVREPEDLSTAYGVIYAVQGLTEWHRHLWIPEKRAYISVTEAELDRAFGSGPHQMMRISSAETETLIAMGLGPPADEPDPPQAGVGGDRLPATEFEDYLDDDAAPEAAALYCRQGVELYFEGRYDEARDRLEKSLRAEEFEEATFFLGLLEAQRGDDVNARFTLRDVMESDDFGDLAVEVITFLDLEWPIIPISAEDLVPDGAAAATGTSDPSYDQSVADTYVIGTDPWSDRLVLVPETAAREDVLFNHAVYEPTTMGKVRAAPGAEEILEEALKHEMESRATGRWIRPRLGRLPDDYPVNISAILNPDNSDQYLILPRLRTAQLAPQEILDEFGLDEPSGGGFSMDYEGATWLDPADRDAISARMAELGLQVREDQGLIDAYLNV
jgi:hypothetical protein